jgi:hypothetical protein
MRINKKQQKVRKNINALTNLITDVIDNYCEENDFEITYAEINSALTGIIKSNLGFELKEMWKEEDEEV